MKETPCSIMRGGTSKAVFFQEKDMPENREEWEGFLLKVMGSPDVRQIDGLGGANSLTSKVAVVKPSDSLTADVDYTFFQVSLNEAKVDMKGNCGNISSAVGPYAVNEGLVEVEDGKAEIRILNTNTNKVILSSFYVKNGRFVSEGNLEISGVPGTGAPIEVTFRNPGGAVTGKELPTGRSTDRIDAGFGPIEISIVDAANPLVFMNAADIGLKGSELPSEFDQSMLDRIEAVRCVAAEMCGFADKKNATKESPAVPKSTIVSAPSDCLDMKNRPMKKEEYQLGIRMMSMQKPHQALAITGAVCITKAAQIEGTIVNRILGGTPADIKIGHPGGIMETRYFQGDDGDGVVVQRTARLLMKGVVYTG